MGKLLYFAETCSQSCDVCYSAAIKKMVHPIKTGIFLVDIGLNREYNKENLLEALKERIKIGMSTVGG